MIEHHAIDTLVSLVQLCSEAARTCHDAGRELADHELTTNLRSMRADHEQNMQELLRLLRYYGVTRPARVPSPVWTSTPSTLDAETVLVRVRATAENVSSRYGELLQEPLPPRVRLALSRQAAIALHHLRYLDEALLWRPWETRELHG